MRYVYLVFDADALADDSWAACGDRLLFAVHAEPASRTALRASPAALAVVEANDLNAAILMASRCPAARAATIEVRPLETKEPEQ